MIDEGAGLIMATVSPDGAPRAVRAWGVGAGADASRLRVVMAADDPVAVGDLATGLVAITAADVRTLRSIQVKGHVTAVEPLTASDAELVRRHTERFFAAVHEVDGTSMALLQRMVPMELLALDVVVDEAFDQTPGPSAGAALAPADP